MSEQNEYQEQTQVIEWAARHEGKWPPLRLLNASLNGVRLPMGLRVKAKRAGMKAGYPDLFLPVSRKGYHGLYIEMKKRNGVPSDVRPEQWDWLSSLALGGYYVAVGFGFYDTVAIIEWYMRG